MTSLFFKFFLLLFGFVPSDWFEIRIHPAVLFKTHLLNSVMHQIKFRCLSDWILSNFVLVYFCSYSPFISFGSEVAFVHKPLQDPLFRLPFHLPLLNLSTGVSLFSTSFLYSLLILFMLLPAWSPSEIV